MKANSCLEAHLCQLQADAASEKDMVGAASLKLLNGH
jgi:hypothetical protein